MKNDNLSHSSNLSLTTDESKSKTSSFSSINMTTLTNNLIKSCDWLNDLLELHYFAYNSCSSLTIYSYKYWSSQKKLLVSTKENNIKEIHFSLVVIEDPIPEQHHSGAEGVVLSTRSSVSSSNSNSNARHDDFGSESRKESISGVENKSNTSINDSEGSYLEPVYKIHKLPKIKSIFFQTKKNV